MKRTLVAATAAAALVTTATLTGCSGGDKPSTHPPTTSASPTPSPTPAWQAEYTPAQVASYEQALATWNRYQQASVAIWAAGKVTPRARQVFRQYWYIPELVEQQLDAAQAVKAKVTGQYLVRSSLPTVIRQGYVEVEQCVDASEVTVTIAGKVQPPAKHPFRRVITLVHPKTSWLIQRLKDPSSGWVKPC